MEKRKYEQQYRQLGLNITYYRKKKGYSQEILAELAATGPNHLSRIERATPTDAPSLDLIFALADALEIEVSKLFEVR